jgi:ABC-type nitrate/sulfonate/bicarbonate transport system substrate-binding protein
MNKRVAIPVLSFLIFSALLVGCNRSSATSANGAAAPTSSQTIRVGTNLALGTMVPFVANEKGFFQQQGLHVKVVDFADGSPIEAFASGQLDIALLGIAPSAIWQGQGVIPNVAPADMPTALFVTREVDAAITWEPYASEAEMKFKNAKVLYDSAAEWRKAYPGSGQLYPVNVVIARQSFIDAHPSELRKFLAAYAQAIKFINGNPDEANKIIADDLQLDTAVVASARHRIDYTWHVDPDATLKTLEWSKQAGYLKEIPTAAKLFDLGYLPAE